MTPRHTVLDSAAKEALRKTIRGLREELLSELMDAARSEYRLDLPPEKAKLPEARRVKRKRLDDWIAEQSRGSKTPVKGKAKAASDETYKRYLNAAVKEAAHTLVNRLVFVRVLEHHGVLRVPVVTGGMQSAGYTEFLHYAGPLEGDDSRGYKALLEAVYAELAGELPGLFGPVGLTALFPVPAATLRRVVEALNEPVLASAWGDDTSFGWVYQYWNDPEREALDEKISGGNKIEPHEIASKTQMFTERYMVEWLLQNSLGLTWLAMCKKHGWTAEAETVLPVLDGRRAEFRGRRERGDVPLDALMPVEPGLESAWKYYVPQPIPADAVEKAPDSIRALRLLDPACGSGHFLVIAFDLLARLYREEARHRQEEWSDADIAQSILANNLHGIDIDPRATQIAAASLWLKAKLHAPDAELRQIHLVAPVFRLAALPKDDPALALLCEELAKLAIPKELTRGLVQALSGVDHLGTLLRVDDAIGGLFEVLQKERGPLFERALERSRSAVEEKIAAFLDAHGTESDLGLRLEGEQLAAGLRFIQLAKEGTYDIVVGNPPYQGLSKTSRFEYVTKNYPRGKADLYAAFLERSLELAKEGGASALLTMRGWMFLGQFAELRKQVLANFDLRTIGDFDRGAFDEVPNEVLAVAAPVIRRSLARSSASVGVQPTPFDDKSYDRQRTHRKRAAVLAQVGRYEFDTKRFEVIEGEPIVYWWTKLFTDRYRDDLKLGDHAPVKQGLATANGTRFLRRVWEVAHSVREQNGSPARCWNDPWPPIIKGADGRAWVEPLTDVIAWRLRAFELRVWIELYRLRSPGQYIKNESFYFRKGIAYTTLGSNFQARAHRFPSVIDVMGASVYPSELPSVLCAMNGKEAAYVLQSLAPGLHFTVGDVNRLPLRKVDAGAQIYGAIERAFATHEASREQSVEFRRTGPSPWRYAQQWAQLAVDRPEGSPLPPYEPEYDPPDPEAELSFAIGVVLGRFGANGEGILDTAPESALPHGILFVGPSDHLPDSLLQAAVQPVLSAADRPNSPLSSGKKTSLRDWLRKDFFAYHKALYENRPIYFPLSSKKRAFVAWVSIHRWTDRTLQALLADHLHPVLRQLDGEIADLNMARASSDKKAASAADRQFEKTKDLRDELFEFIGAVTACAERGAPPTDPACPPRKADAAFVMDLDDGVMINSAALWPLLAPQWADPKKWWKQLCLADGRKDYDWAHLARRYFPARVDDKCKTDPSLAVAHGCFWRYHPAKAYAWELRLKDEIRPDFTIDETDSDAMRAKFVAEHADEARALEAAEMKRRERKAAKAEAEDEGAGEAETAEEDSD